MADKKTDPFKETIKAYLDKLASEDELFAKTYAKENKSIDECVKYIYQEVKKSGRCGFNDDEIFGMAVHYYDEDDLGKITGPNASVVVKHAIELTEEEKEAARKRAIADFEASEKRRLQAASARAKTSPKSTPKPKKEIKPEAPSTPNLFDFFDQEDEAEE